MLPLAQDENSLLFADIRGVAANDPSREGNLGIGYRWIPEERNSILGLYAFADRRQTASGNLWDQITTGVEWIGETTDIRLNAYFPRTQRQLASSVVDDKIVVSGTNLIYQDALLQTYETALSGFDAGVTHRLSRLGGDTWVTLRGFHFSAEDVPSVTGANLRLETRIHDILNTPGAQFVLGVEGQTDTYRGAQGFVTFGVSFPFGAGNTPGGGSSERAAAGEVRSRMMEPVQRDIDIVVTPTLPVRVIEAESDPIDIVSGEKVTGILFVSADGIATAEGDPEDPLDVEGVNARLAEAADEGVRGMLVVPIGSDDIHTGSTGLVLMPGNILMSKGNLVFESSTTGRRLTFVREVEPTIVVNDATSPVVVVTENNRIVGIETSGGEYAVYGDAAAGEFSFEGVAFLDAAASAIGLTAASGKALDVQIKDAELSGDQGVSIDLTGAASARVEIAGSAMASQAGPVVALTGPAEGDVAFFLTDSVLTSLGLGLSLMHDSVQGGLVFEFASSEISSQGDSRIGGTAAEDGWIVLTVAGNTVDAGEDGVVLDAITSGGSIRVEIGESEESAQSITAGGDGIILDLETEALNGWIIVEGQGNTVTAGGDGIDAEIEAINGNVTVTLEENTLTAEAMGASFDVMTDEGDIAVEFAGNTVTAGEDGVFATMTTEYGNVGLTWTGNTVTAGDDGFEADVVSYGDVDLNWSGNTINAADDGMTANVAIDASIHVYLEWNENTITAGYAGMDAYVEGNRAYLSGSVNDNVVSAGYRGIGLGVSAYDGAEDAKAKLDVGIARNVIGGNEDDALEYGIDVWLESESDGDFILTLDENRIEATDTGVSVWADVSDYGYFDLSAYGNVIGAPDGESLDYGIDVYAYFGGDGSVYTDFDDNRIEAYEVGIGVEAYVEYDGGIEISLDGNTVTSYWEGVTLDAYVDEGDIEIDIGYNELSAEWSPLAIYAEGAYDGEIEVDVYDNQVVGNQGRLFNGAYAMYIDVHAYEDAFVSVTYNDVVSEGASGINVNLVSGDFADLELYGNSVRVSENGIGIYVDSYDSWVFVEWNDIWAINKGLTVTAAEGSYVELDVVGNLFRAIENVVIWLRALPDSEIEHYIVDNDYRYIPLVDQVQKLVEEEIGTGSIYPW